MKKILIITSVVVSVLAGGIFLFINKSTPQNIPSKQSGETLLLTDVAQIAPIAQGGGLSQNTSNLELVPLVEISATPPTVEYGGKPTVISWKSANATSCVSGEGDQLRNTGSISITPAEKYTLEIICTNSKGKATASVTVPVTKSPIVALSAYPDTVNLGEQSFISWSTINTTSCVDGTGKILELNGSFSVTPRKKYKFDIVCTGADGEMKKSVTITVVFPTAPTPTQVKTPTQAPIQTTTPLPQITFISYPSTVQNGQHATLSWTAINATSCSASGDWNGTKEISGTETTTALVGPQTYKYTLSCKGDGGTVKQNTTIDVTVAISCATPWDSTLGNSISVKAYESSSVNYGSTCASETRTCNNGTLSGSYVNKSCVVAAATSCTTPWGSTLSNSLSVKAYESPSVSFGSTCVSETRTCNNGTLSGTYVNKSCVVAAAPAPQITFTVSPSAVNYDETATLTWSTTDAASCTASGGWTGSVATSSTFVTPKITSLTNFGITCVNSSGNSVQKAVSIDPLPPKMPGCVNPDTLFGSQWWPSCNAQVGTGWCYPSATSTNESCVSKLYKYSNISSACPAGYRVPTVSDYRAINAVWLNSASFLSGTAFASGGVHSNTFNMTTNVFPIPNGNDWATTDKWWTADLPSGDSATIASITGSSYIRLDMVSSISTYANAVRCIRK